MVMRKEMGKCEYCDKEELVGVGKDNTPVCEEHYNEYLDKVFFTAYVAIMLILLTFFTIWVAIGEWMPLWLRIFVTSVAGLGIILLVLNGIKKENRE